MKEDCVFCKILKGELPGSFIFKDKICTAFLDIQPINPGHVLVIPNQHAANLNELPPETGAHIFKTAQKICTALYQSEIACQGINLFLADGEAAFQDVFHIHLHLIPRYKGDGFKLSMGNHYHNLPERNKLDLLAKHIKTKL